MPIHIIIGYGDWGRKIANFLVNQKFFKKIYIKNSSKFFEIYPKYKNLGEGTFKNELNKIDTAHICSPVQTHLKYFKILHTKNVILEKPIVLSSAQLKIFKKIYKKKRAKTLVNYTDLLNKKVVNLKKIIKKKKITKINLIYVKKKKKYYNRFDFFNDWLDHPLSIVLFLFGKFKKYKLLFKLEKANKKYFNGELNINFKFTSIFVNILISNIKKNDERSMYIQSKNLNYKVDLRKNNSFKGIYNQLLTKNKNPSFQNLKFYEKILLEKEKIIKEIKKL
tara:strand:- start:809 stop:1645 length:837 start_codon:yes stop_codon:yes gene_type:complete